MATDFSLIQGTLDALILKTLSWGPRHGYGIARWIKDTSDEALDVEDRALYLALHRLEEREWVEAEWGTSENNRRAKFYRLTTAGRRQLKTELDRLTTYTEALFKVLRSTGDAS
jgi:PadR family transcriptional regulator PadR